MIKKIVLTVTLGFVGFCSAANQPVQVAKGFTEQQKWERVRQLMADAQASVAGDVTALNRVGQAMEWGWDCLLVKAACMCLAAMVACNLPSDGWLEVYVIEDQGMRVFFIYIPLLMYCAYKGADAARPFMNKLLNRISGSQDRGVMVVKTVIEHLVADSNQVPVELQAMAKKLAQDSKDNKLAGDAYDRFVAMIESMQKISVA